MLTVVLMAAACGRAEPERRPAAHEVAQADTAVVADSTAEEGDRPCFAANLGLPCK
jgi:hypothetical protein